MLHVAADIKAAAAEALEVRRESDHFIQEWMDNVGEGIPGYVTPKVAIGAVVGNAAGEILLVQRGWRRPVAAPHRVGRQRLLRPARWW